MPNDRELKFLVPTPRAAFLLRWLSAFCQPDPEFPVNRVFTLYYDTLEQTLLREKLNSDYLKTKVRLRWYSAEDMTPQSDGGWLEIKQKIGDRRHKIRIPVPHSEHLRSPLPLDHPVWRTFLCQLDEQGIAGRERLFPVLLLTYIRHRFREPMSGLRLALDCQVQVMRVNPQIVLTPLPKWQDLTVFEAKGAVGTLPPTLHPIIAMGARKIAISKYAWCYQQLSEG